MAGWVTYCAVLLTLGASAVGSVAAERHGGAGESEALARLQLQVGELKDRQDIADVLQRYIRGIDRHDKDLARSAFWPDARIDLGTPMGRQDYVNHEEKALAAYAAHQHHITGQTVEIDGKTAHVESYVFFIAVPRDRHLDEAGPATPGHALTGEKTEIGSGRYIERWEKRNGEWKILVREYVHELTVKGDTVDHCSARPCLSRWDRGDLSYVRPLEPLTLEARRARAEANKKTRSFTR
jgi:hypothetical protein